MHLVLNMFMFTRTLVTYARTTFKPRCCLNFQSMHMQAESTYIAHNMFGQIKIKRLWYSSRHSLNNRKRDGKPRLIVASLLLCMLGSPTQRLSRKRKEKTMQAVKPLPTLIKKKEPRTLVPSTIKLLHCKKERRNQWGSRGLQAWPETGS